MKIWVDMDHSPHVQVFRPLIPELEKRGAEVFVTARDFNQTVGLCRLWNIPATVVGKHGGRNKVGKVLNLFHRSGQLWKAVRSWKPDLAVSHGARTQLVAAKLMRVPSVLMMDYEYTEAYIFRTLSTRLYMPERIPDARLEEQGFPLNKVRRYPGLKEELYLPLFDPDPGFRAGLDIPDEAILITIRPSAMVANYHDARSEVFLLGLLERALQVPDAYPLVISRTREDRELIEGRFGKGRVRFLDQAVDGLQLIWHSDVLVSGGGTMNREAAVLGVPVYSIFTGRRPYLDEYLAAQGRMSFVEAPEQLDSIRIEKRAIPPQGPSIRPGLAGKVAEMLLSEA